MSSRSVTIAVSSYAMQQSYGNVCADGKATGIGWTAKPRSRSPRQYAQICRALELQYETGWAAIRYGYTAGASVTDLLQDLRRRRRSVRPLPGMFRHPTRISSRADPFARHTQS